jgi:hypothetical protein
MWWLLSGCQISTFEIVLEDQNNYAFDASFFVESTPILEAEDALLQWTDISTDLLGNELELSDIDRLSIIRFPRLSQEAVLIGLEHDTLKQSDLSGGVELDASDRTEAWLSEFSMQGTTLNPENELKEELGTYLIFGNKEERVVSLHFFAPRPEESNQEILLSNQSTVIEYTVGFGEDILVEDARELYLDWSNLTETGTGNPIDLVRIDRLVLAGFSQDLEALESDFLRSRALAEVIVEADVAGVDAIPFSRIEGFEFFDPELTWLIALECSLCLNPAPFFVGMIQETKDN